MDGVDNSKLKSMMVIDPDTESDEEQKLFFDELKNSTMLVALKDNGLPYSLKTEMGNFIVPLFTDEEELEKVEIFKDSHHAWIKTELICVMLTQLEQVDDVAINPMSPHAIGMDYGTFLSIFSKEKIEEIEEVIKLYGESLPEDSRFYFREESPNMKKVAVDGVFTADTPFLADFKDSFDEKKPYVNILLIPKGTRFLVVGDNDEICDTVFAPTLKFKLIEEDGKTVTWQCISQELKYKKKSNKIIYLIIAIIFIVLIITLIKVIM